MLWKQQTLLLQTTCSLVILQPGSNPIEDISLKFPDSI